MEMRRNSKRWGARLVVSAVFFVSVAACGASMERTARAELAERNMQQVTLQPIESRSNAFTFEATRDGVPCRGEIELGQEMGQTVATVTSQCGDE
jgi:hypothetical protein